MGLWVRRTATVAASLAPRSTHLQTHKLSHHQGCVTSPLHLSEHAQELQMALQPPQRTSNTYKSVQTAFVSPARCLWGFQDPTPGCLLSILCFPSTTVLDYVYIMFAKQDLTITTSREIHRGEGKVKSCNSTTQRTAVSS